MQIYKQTEYNNNIQNSYLDCSLRFGDYALQILRSLLMIKAKIRKKYDLSNMPLI